MFDSKPVKPTSVGEIQKLTSKLTETGREAMFDFGASLQQIGEYAKEQKEARKLAELENDLMRALNQIRELETENKQLRQLLRLENKNAH